MPVTRSCTAVDQTAGNVVFTLSDGSQIEFTSKQQVHDLIDPLDTDATLAVRFLIARWARNNPNLTNPQNIVGHSCTLDISLATPVTFT